VDGRLEGLGRAGELDLEVRCEGGFLTSLFLVGGRPLECDGARNVDDTADDRVDDAVELAFDEKGAEKRDSQFRGSEWLDDDRRLSGGSWG
jgi:hypothetical protein